MFRHPYFVRKKFGWVFDIIVNFIYLSKLSDILFHLSNKFYKNRIRVVIYHSVSEKNRLYFEAHIKFYKKHYRIIDQDELKSFFDGQLELNKQGLIITFDDGFRNNFEIAVPILEQYNIKGWFFIPSKILELRKDEQELFAKNNRLGSDELSLNRLFMNSDEIIELSKKHIIGYHTYNHVRLPDDVSENKELLLSEIIGGKEKLEKVISTNIKSFAWVGGEEKNYSYIANQMIIKSGFLFSFLTRAGLVKRNSNPFLIHRTHIPIEFNIKQIRFQLSGIIDLLFGQSRKRVNKRLFKK